MRTSKLLACIALLAAGPVLAADNFAVKDASGTTITKASKQLGDSSQADKNMLIDSSGVEKGTSGNPWSITATALPLPTGSATSANQSSELTKLDTLHTDMIAPTPAGTNVIGKVAATPDVASSGTIDATTLNATNAVTASGMAGLGIEVGAGLGGGAILTPEAQTVAGGTWDATSLFQIGTGLKVSTVTAAGRYDTNVAGKAAFRLRVSTAGTGAAVPVSFNLTRDANILKAVNADKSALLATVTPADVSNLAPAQVSVGATATVIAAARAGRQSITVVNHGTTNIFIGGSGVTATTGILLPGVVGASITLNSAAALYGITASGSQTVSEIETY